MPRNISFALTTPQFLDGSKDVTRRMGWKHLKAGDVLCAVKKGMGLKPGEKIERLGMIRVISVRRERLSRLIEDLEYGFAETVREGFPKPSPNYWPGTFIEFFCASHKDCGLHSEVTRIEFERIPDPSP